MENKQNYNTKQRLNLIQFFKNNPGECFSAKEIIKNPEISLGEATIYRSLSKFVSEGKLKKYISPDGEGAFYQYNDNALNPACNDHFHLKCISCGTLVHMDCELMGSIKEHIDKEHGFSIDNSKTTLYGLCSKCKS